jgi:hypothetical protein
MIFLLRGGCRRFGGDQVPVGRGLIGKRHLAAFFPQDAVVETDLLIEKEAEKEGGPGFVIIERIIVFRGGLTDRGQLIPGNGRKVVVFVMMTHVKGDQVEPAIVAMGLLMLIVGKIVFLYPAGAERVEADGEEEAGEQVNDRFRPGDIPDCGDKDGFEGPIQRYPSVKRFDLAKPGNAKDLEKRIEQQPDKFTDKIVVDQAGFPAVGQIGIELVDTLEGVVFDVVSFEGDGVREKLGQVGQDAGEPVGGAAFEQQVVCAFMDHDEEGVVGKCAQEISCAEDQPPGAVAKQEGQADLKQYETEDGEDRVFVLSDELSHFGVLLQDLFSTEAMRLLLLGINKIDSFCHRFFYTIVRRRESVQKPFPSFLKLRWRQFA